MADLAAAGTPVAATPPAPPPGVASTAGATSAADDGPPSDSGKPPMPDYPKGHPMRPPDWVDITSLVDDACGSMGAGEMLHGPAFTLEHTMSAVELFDPKMDPHSDSTTAALPSVEDCIRDGTLPMQLSVDDALAVLDKLLDLEASWHDGNSLAQTVCAVMYAKRPGINALLRTAGRPPLPVAPSEAGASEAGASSSAGASAGAGAGELDVAEAPEGSVPRVLALVLAAYVVSMLRYLQSASVVVTRQVLHADDDFVPYAYKMDVLDNVAGGPDAADAYAHTLLADAIRSLGGAAGDAPGAGAAGGAAAGAGAAAAGADAGGAGLTRTQKKRLRKQKKKQGAGAGETGGDGGAAVEVPVFDSSSTVANDAVVANLLAFLKLRQAMWAMLSAARKPQMTGTPEALRFAGLCRACLHTLSTRRATVKPTTPPPKVPHAPDDGSPPVECRAVPSYNVAINRYEMAPAPPRLAPYLSSEDSVKFLRSHVDDVEMCANSYRLCCGFRDELPPIAVDLEPVTPPGADGVGVGKRDPQLGSNDSLMFATMVRFLEVFASRSPGIVARSLLVSIMLQTGAGDDVTTNVGTKSLFGRVATVDLLCDSFERYGAHPRVRGLPAVRYFAEMMTDPVCQLIKLMCTNPARGRRKMKSALRDWDVVMGEAGVLDAEVIRTEKVDGRQYYHRFETWAAEFTLWLHARHVAMGIEQELFEADEIDVAYWYIKRLNEQRVRNFEIAKRAWKDLNKEYAERRATKKQAVAGRSKKRKANKGAAAAAANDVPPDVRELNTPSAFACQIQIHMNVAMQYVTQALRKLGFLKPPWKQSYLDPDTRFQVRTREFSAYERPAAGTFGDYLRWVSACSALTPREMLARASRFFDQVRDETEFVIHESRGGVSDAMRSDLLSWKRVAITNNVAVMRLLGSGELEAALDATTRDLYGRPEWAPPATIKDGATAGGDGDAAGAGADDAADDAESKGTEVEVLQPEALLPVNVGVAELPRNTASLSFGAHPFYGTIVLPKGKP